MINLFECYRAQDFKAYLEVLATMNEEVTFNIDETGLKVNQLDKEHVGLILFKLPPQFFDRFNEEYQSEKITVNLNDLLSSIKKLEKDEKLIAEYDEENQKLILSLVSDLRRKKIIPCLETIEEEIPEPKIFFKTKTRIVNKALKRIIDDFKNNSEHLKLESFHNEDSIKFSNDSDQYEESVTLTRDNDNILETKVDDECKAVYPVSYFDKFISKALKVSEVSTLSFTEDMPIKIDVEIPQGMLYLWVAPCIGI